MGDCSCLAGCVYCEVDDQPIDVPNHWLIQAPTPPTFTDELKRAQLAAGLTNKGLASAAGYSKATIDQLRHGRTPSIVVARRIADVLEDELVFTTAAAALTVECALCRGHFVRANKAPQGRYCSKKCRDTAAARRHRQRRATLEQVARYRMAIHEEAIAAFCRRCSPDLVCRQASCPLRPVSPLRLAESYTKPAQPEAARRRRRPRALAPETHPGTIVQRQRTSRHDEPERRTRWW